jgi:hypothetical protein
MSAAPKKTTERDEADPYPDLFSSSTIASTVISSRGSFGSLRPEETLLLVLPVVLPRVLPPPTRFTLRTRGLYLVEDKSFVRLNL